MRLWELIRLALDGVRRTPLRVALTSLGVAIASGALLTMVAFALGVQARVEEPFQKAELLNRIDVWTQSSPRRGPHTPSAAEDDPDAPAPVLDDQALSEIANLDGVALVYPELRVDRVRVSHGDQNATTSVSGLPPQAVSLRFVRDAMKAGRFLDGERQAVLGLKLVEKLGFASPEAAVGQTLTLSAKGLSTSAAKSFELNEYKVEVEVVGVWAPPRWRRGLGEEDVLLPVDLVREMPGIHFASALDQMRRGTSEVARGYDRVVVRVLRPSDLFLVDEQLKKMGFQTQTLMNILKDMRTAFLVMDLVLTAVGTVALVVAGLGIVNTLLMSVLERYREIGTYKALGASDGDVRILFLAEAGLVGLLGGLGGIALGRVVSMVIETVVNHIAPRYGIEEPIIVFSFPLWLLLDALLFAIAVSVVSGVYPASRAARVDPIRALRSE